MTPIGAAGRPNRGGAYETESDGVAGGPPGARRVPTGPRRGLAYGGLAYGSEGSSRANLKPVVSSDAADPIKVGTVNSSFTIREAGPAQEKSGDSSWTLAKARIAAKSCDNLKLVLVASSS